MKNIDIIFGLDKNGKDIFVIKKNMFFHFFYEEPTNYELQELAVELGLSHKDIEYIKNELDEWIFYLNKRNNNQN